MLVNNAGILKTAPLAQTSDELYARHFAINTQGVFNTLREAATRLNDGGRIINLSSTTLALNLPGYAIYNGTKAAVEAFTRVFAKELRGRRITVNAVAPGPVATALFLDNKTEEQIQTFAKMPPLERLGEPDDIAGVVAFLAGKTGHGSMDRCCAPTVAWPDKAKAKMSTMSHCRHQRHRHSSHRLSP